MNKKRKVEVFTAGCLICEKTIKRVKEMACENCEVIVYNLNKPCESGECIDKVKEYGIANLPAIFVEGEPVGGCTVAGSTVEELMAAGIGKSVC